MLSIIIPCYNVYGFIDEALDSLLNQPYTINQDFEIICVDDHSNDGTLSRLNHYKKSGVRIISLEKNGGVSHARNAGMHYAHGDFIWFFDADDIAAPGSMQIIFSSITSHKEIDALRFPAIYVEEQSRIENIIIINRKPTKDNLYCFVIKHSFLFEKNISFCERMTYSEDVAFLCLCFINEMRIKDISTPLYYYRQRLSSLMHNRNEIKHFKSICQLPCYYNDYKAANWLLLSDNQRRKLQGLIFDATQACLIHAVKRPTTELKKIVNNLSFLGLYPYPLRWNLLSLEHGILTVLSKSRYLLLPIYGYLLTLNRIILKRFKNK